ncbi:MAG: hypothetical protein QM644_13620 [Mobilitalea sp.]
MANNSTSMKITLKISSFIFRLLLNIAFYILLVIMIVNFSRTAYNFTYQLYGNATVDPVGSGKEIIFQIKKGEKTMDIATKLELYNAIENKYSFYLKTKLQEYNIMPGTYQLSSDMTYTQILNIITDYSASIIQEEDPEAEEEEAGSDADSN